MYYFLIKFTDKKIKSNIFDEMGWHLHTHIHTNGKEEERYIDYFSRGQTDKVSLINKNNNNNNSN